MNPWDRVKSGSEHAEQSALFAWANMAARFGFVAAADRASYTVAGHAMSRYGPGGRCGTVFKDTFGPAAVPELLRLHAIHNQGHGDAIRGNRAKTEGVKRGVPDTFLPVPRMARTLDPETWGGFVAPFGEYPGSLGGVVCGLYVELKKREILKPGKRKAQVIQQRAGETSEDQDEWIAYLRSVGFAVAVCEGWEAAARIIAEYCGGVAFPDGA